MKTRKIAAATTIATLVLGVGATAAFADTSTSTPSTASTCLPAGHDDAWPLWTDGNPGRSPGIAVYHDANGWHVRATHNALHDRTFSGVIRTTGELVDVKGVGLERNDSVKVGPDKHTIVFRFNNYGRVDGVDFATHCAPALEFGFVTDGHRVPVGNIAIGLTARHPRNNPFVIARKA